MDRAEPVANYTEAINSRQKNVRKIIKTIFSNVKINVFYKYKRIELIIVNVYKISLKTFSKCF